MSKFIQTHFFHSSTFPLSTKQIREKIKFFLSSHFSTSPTKRTLRDQNNILPIYIYIYIVRDRENLGALRKGCKHRHLPFFRIMRGVANYFFIKKKNTIHNSHVNNTSNFINWLYKYNLVEYLYKALVLDTIYVKKIQSFHPRYNLPKQNKALVLPTKNSKVWMLGYRMGRY